MASKNLEHGVTFERLESDARSYCRRFPALFKTALGSVLHDANGSEYLDFLSCAGALNYGHNHPVLKDALIKYLQENGIQGSLDLYTQAKLDFVSAFRDHILSPRGLAYKLQFTSPTGTSVVESAVKLARKVTKRKNVISFTNAFHGMTGVSLGLTGNSYHRQNVQDNNVTRMPYDGYMENLDTIAYLRKFLQDKSSGVDDPAAIIVETIQGEGGVNVASAHWIRELSQLAKLHGALLIIDDVQAGCGRTGDFFSFEFSDISPDMVCLSKSISGYGLPFSLLLIAPSHDKWDPAEDNGTFRGNNLAFISGAAAIKYFWSDSSFSSSIRLKEKIIIRAAEQMRDMFPQVIKSVRGRGLFYGIEFWNPETAKEVSAKCFEKKLIVETCGSDDQVIKLFPALNIPDNLLNRGMSILNDAVQTQHNFTSN